MKLKVTGQPIDVNEALAYVRDESCGAVTMFEGNIRNTNDGAPVTALEYEVYDKLLESTCRKIYDEIIERWSIHRMMIIQRIGRLEVGDTGIVVAVSSGHRREALEALDYAIEEFKHRAPVWKKEYGTSGHKWVNWTEQLSK